VNVISEASRDLCLVTVSTSKSVLQVPVIERQLEEIAESTKLTRHALM
jgi:hypothetical protein